MAELTVNQGSWLRLVDLLTFKGVEFWDHVTYPDIPLDDDDQFVQIDRNLAKRVDVLADQAYGDVDLWWVILTANNIDLPNQLVEGMTIRIPARATIDRLLNRELGS